MSTQVPMLAATGVSKTFPAGPWWKRQAPVMAIRNVSLTVPAGMIYGLVGESGSGKSTLARALLFLDPPTSGTVRVAGTALHELSSGELRRFRRRMQLVLQDPAGALDPRLRAGDSIRVALATRAVGRAQGQSADDRVTALGELVGLPGDRLRLFPHQLSGGQRQRVVLARALAVEPEVLILDEPVSKLDVSIQAQIINLLSDLHSRLGLTYLFISHDLRLVGYFSEYIAVMYRGRIVEMAPAASLLARAQHPYTRHLLSASAAGRVSQPPGWVVSDAATLRQVDTGHFVLEE